MLKTRDLKGVSPLKTDALLACEQGKIRHYLIGYYGFGNAGDEHLLRQTQSLIAPHPFWVLPRQRLTGLLHALTHIPFSAKIVFGGGSLFQDSSSAISMIYYLLLLSWAVLWQKPICLLGHGLGPIRRSWLRKWLGHLLPRITVISRDALSHQLFLSLGSDPSHTHLGTDLAYLSGPQPLQFSPAGQLVIATKGRQSTTFSSILTGHHRALLWLTLHEGIDDAQTPHAQMTPQLDIPDHGPYAACISMRYHACVWASLRGVPFLAIGDDPKLRALAEAFGQPCVGLAELAGTLPGFFAALTQYQARVVAALPALCETAQRVFTPSSYRPLSHRHHLR